MGCVGSFNNGCTRGRPVDHRAAFGVNNTTELVFFPGDASRTTGMVGFYHGRGVECVTINGNSGLLITSSKVGTYIVYFNNSFSSVGLLRGNIVCTRDNTSLVGIYQFTLRGKLSNLRFTFKVPNSYNNTTFVGTNTCNNRVGSILFGYRRVSGGNSFNALSNSRLTLSCERSTCCSGRYVMANLCVELRGNSGTRVGTGVRSFLRHEGSGRPLRCPDTNSAFGHPRKCFTNTLVRRYNLGNGEMNNTRVDAGRTNFIVGGNKTAYGSILGLYGRYSRAICRGGNIGLRVRVEMAR